MLIDLSSWWNTLSFFEQLYWIIAIPFTLLFVIQLILTFVGGDVDGDMDHDFDDGGGFHLITVKNMIAFFAIFAWSGLACIDIFGNQAYTITIVISTLSGLLMMIIMASLYYFMSRLTHSGTMNLNNALSQVGDVYISIPERKSGLGKVQIKVQGAIRELDAMTEDTESIKTGSIIEVVDIINDRILLVRRSR